MTLLIPNYESKLFSKLTNKNYKFYSTMLNEKITFLCKKNVRNCCYMK